MLLCLCLPLQVSAQAKCIVDYDGNDVEFAYDLGLKASTGVGAELDHCRAAGLYRWAAERGHAGAQYGLARKYAEGWGENRDDVQSYMWAKLAEQNPEPGYFKQHVATRLLKILEKDMSRVEIEEAERRALECSGSNLHTC